MIIFNYLLKVLHRALILPLTLLLIFVSFIAVMGSLIIYPVVWILTGYDVFDKALDAFGPTYRSDNIRTKLEKLIWGRK